jgi:hypothetical protein
MDATETMRDFVGCNDSLDGGAWSSDVRPPAGRAPETQPATTPAPPPLPNQVPSPSEGATCVATRRPSSSPAAPATPHAQTAETAPDRRARRELAPVTMHTMA